jgi:hypothetical protein
VFLDANVLIYHFTNDRFEDWVEDGQAGANGHSAAGNGQAANEPEVASR